MPVTKSKLIDDVKSLSLDDKTLNKLISVIEKEEEKISKKTSKLRNIIMVKNKKEIKKMKRRQEKFENY